MRQRPPIVGLAARRSCPSAESSPAQAEPAGETDAAPAVQHAPRRADRARGTHSQLTPYRVEQKPGQLPPAKANRSARLTPGWRPVGEPAARDVVTVATTCGEAAHARCGLDGDRHASDRLTVTRQQAPGDTKRSVRNPPTPPRREVPARRLAVPARSSDPRSRCRRCHSHSRESRRSRRSPRSRRAVSRPLAKVVGSARNGSLGRLRTSIVPPATPDAPSPTLDRDRSPARARSASTSGPCASIVTVRVDRAHVACGVLGDESGPGASRR